MKRLLALVGPCLLSAACGSSSSATAPTTPASNRPPVIGALTASPQGLGLQSATIFTFLGQNVSDPDGDTLTYSWLSSDGASIASSTQAASHVYDRSGTFDMRLTVTDPKGLSTSATISIKVGTVTGVWDVSCDNRSADSIRFFPNFPSQFVVTLLQDGTSLRGSMAAQGRERNFTLPGVASNPRAVVFGVETIDNTWADADGDFYFRLAADDAMTSMSSTSGGFYCGSSVARKR